MWPGGGHVVIPTREPQSPPPALCPRASVSQPWLLPCSWLPASTEPEDPGATLPTVGRRSHGAQSRHVAELGEQQERGHVLLPTLKRTARRVGTRRRSRCSC